MHMHALMERPVPDTQEAFPEVGKEQRPASDHPSGRLQARRKSVGGSWAGAVICLWGAHENAGMWVNFSSLTTSHQPRRQSKHVTHHKGSHAGTDLKPTSHLKEYPLVNILPILMATPSTALEN